MGKVLAKWLLKAVLLLFLGLVLFGVFSRSEAWIAVVVFVIWRLTTLVVEWRRSRLPEPDWRARAQELLARYRQEVEVLEPFYIKDPSLRILDAVRLKKRTASGDG